MHCSTEKVITVIVTSNINGAIRDCGCAGIEMGGFPRLKTYLDKERNHSDSLLLIDTGDSHPSFSYPKKSYLVSHLMKELDFDFILKADQEPDTISGFNQNIHGIHFLYRMKTSKSVLMKWRD